MLFDKISYVNSKTGSFISEKACNKIFKSPSDGEVKLVCQRQPIAILRLKTEKGVRPISEKLYI